MWCGRAGFTLLEAVVALAIVSLVGVASLGAVGTELRTADRARRTLEAAALSEERLAMLAILDIEELEHLPDSQARGGFGPPFGSYVWDASSDVVRGEPGLYRIAVEVSSADVAYRLETKVFRPTPEGLP